MSKKAYSEQEREQVGRDLLAVGLEMLSQRGLKDTTLQDILKAVHISKTFFYGSFYPSLAELVIGVINYQQDLLLQMARREAERPHLEERIGGFLRQVTYSRKHHFFVMTQEEEVWLHRHLSREDFELFQSGQVLFYGQLLALWNIPEEKCAPMELGNLVLSIVLIYNSAAQSLPFFFPEESERTAQAQIKALTAYLVSLSDARE